MLEERCCLGNDVESGTSARMHRGTSYGLRSIFGVMMVLWGEVDSCEE